ncbi:MAG: D-hexose-6-phosphate mutarotase [Thermoflexales bacterium]|nr:D-hexose-6-phosphate mutarotase [Thermoflexales bacterium]
MSLQLVTGMGGLPKMVLAAEDGAQVEIYLHGGHVASWKPAGEERLFMSRTSEFRAGVAIRGGVPVCFPQFAGFGPLPKHGLVRTLPWTINAVTANSLTLHRTESAATLAAWPHAFTVALTVTLGGPTLSLEFEVTNTGAAPFEFAGALHTYFLVRDVRSTVIEGLSGRRYADRAGGGFVENVQSEKPIAFDGEVDRVCYDAPERVIIREPDRSISVMSRGFPDVVVWNPGPVMGAKMSDLEPDGYLRMVCVEAAAVGKPIVVEPQATWRGAQIVTI